MNNTYLGRLGSDPALRFSENGKAWMAVGFAIDVRVKEGDEWISKPIWTDLKIFGPMAEQVASVVSKGSSLIVVGELHPTEYVNKEGDTVKGTQLIAQEVGMNIRFGLG